MWAAGILQRFTVKNSCAHSKCLGFHLDCCWCRGQFLPLWLCIFCVFVCVFICSLHLPQSPYNGLFKLALCFNCLVLHNKATKNTENISYIPYIIHCNSLVFQFANLTLSGDVGCQYPKIWTSWASSKICHSISMVYPSNRSSIQER